MSFLRAAGTALRKQQWLRGMLAASALIFVAAFFVSCGGANNARHGSLSHSAYVTLPTQGSVLQLLIDGATGQIINGTQTPQQAGTSPNGLALLSSNKFLYVANGQANTISVFNVASDGTLALTGSPTPAGTGPHSAVIDPSGKYLLVTNTFSNNVSVFSINSSSGALQEVAGSPFYANNSPTEIVVSGASQFVYVSNPTIGMVTAFTFSTSSGALAPIPGSPFFSGLGASGLVAAANGSFLYVANSSALNPGLSTIGNVSGFNIDPTTGALSPISGSPFTSVVGSGPSALVFDPAGRFLFATAPGSSFSVWCFAITSTTGQLTAVPNSPFSVAAGGLFALIDTSGNYFYIGSQSAHGIEAYTYDQNTGQPTVIGNSPYSTGGAPGKMVISY